MSHQKTVLIVGGGGREHAIAWKLAQSPLLGSLYAAPGNAGIAELATCVPVSADDLEGQVRLAREIRADLVVIGPELPLSLGLVDALEAVGIAAIGPTQAAARIESSKQFAKEIMQAAGIPTAAYHVATDIEAAEAIIHAHFGSGIADRVAEPYVLAEACDCGPDDGGPLGDSADAAARATAMATTGETARATTRETTGSVTGAGPGAATEGTAVGQPGPLVVKADGLAAGKGVVICHSADEALAVTRDMLSGVAHGSAGATVVFEQFLTGPEVSLLAFCDGERVLPMPLAQDYKRLLTGDDGPNTGGMGSISPVPGCDDALHDELVRTCIQPLIAEMARRGIPFKGILFAGLMLTPTGPVVLEYNARFGDPETQSLMRRLDSDLLEIFLAMAAGDLGVVGPTWSDLAACGVVMAARGYPDEPERGVPIGGVERFAGADAGAGGGGSEWGLSGSGSDGSGSTLEGESEKPDDTSHHVVIFHGGTARDDRGQLVSSGGRVLSVTAVGGDLPVAIERTYAAIESITFPGSQYRTDIGRSVVD